MTARRPLRAAYIKQPPLLLNPYFIAAPTTQPDVPLCYWAVKTKYYLTGLLSAVLYPSCFRLRYFNRPYCINAMGSPPL